VTLILYFGLVTQSALTSKFVSQDDFSEDPENVAAD